MNNKNLYLLIFFVLLACKNPSAKVMQEDEIKEIAVQCENCNIQLLKDVRFNIENIEQDKLELYLQCLNKECFNNVEFGQAANYTLFVLLQEQAKLVISSIGTNVETVDLKYIKWILENPVSDDIDVKKTYQVVNNIQDVAEEVKAEILKSLKIAVDKL